MQKIVTIKIQQNLDTYYCTNFKLYTKKPTLKWVGFFNKNNLLIYSPITTLLGNIVTLSQFSFL